MLPRSTVLAVMMAWIAALAPASAASATGTAFMNMIVSHMVAPDPVPQAPESALTGIGMDLPPLSARERKRLTAQADAGDLRAMYALAHHALHHGSGLYFGGSWGDIQETERWWRKAAALGDPKAMILLGHMYAEPWGVRQDLAQAADWFHKAADVNRLEAVQDLIDLYLGAWSNERDEVAATVWLKRAAALGDHHAMLLLGLRYDAGWGVHEDAAEAAGWYRKTIADATVSWAGSDRRIAMNNLGALYETGRGVAKDEVRAAELYGKAAGYPSLSATYNLAVLCEAGRGVPQDRTAALWLYRQAALFGLPTAREALDRLGFHAVDPESEAGELLRHDKEKRKKSACDP